jgi:hypothetical protein
MNAATRTAEPPTPSQRWRRRLITAGVLAGLGAFVWSRLPKGSYPTDLSLIGQGQPALVLAMDSHYMGGAAVMNLLNGLRRDFADSVHFLVASMSLAEGLAFAQKHQAGDGTVVLFNGQGQRVAVLHSPESPEELRQALQQVIGR